METDTPQPLAAIVDDTFATQDAALRRAVARVDTITSIDGTNVCTVVWHFEDTVPEFEYADTTSTVTVDGVEAQVRFKSVTDADRHIDEWIIRPIPHITLGTPHGDTEVEPLARAFDEITLTPEQFTTLLTPRDDTESRLVDFVGLRAVTTETGTKAFAAGSQIVDRLEDASATPEAALEGSEPVDNALHFTVLLARQSHHELKGFNSEYRFDHVQYITLNGQQYPVTIETLPANEMDNLSGQPVHVSEQMAEWTGLEPLTLSDELAELSVDGLLHGDRLYPDSPQDWSKPTPL